MSFRDKLQILIQQVGNIYQLATDIGWGSARMFELARGTEQPTAEEEAQMNAHFERARAELGTR